jgi:hypothetical protein
LGVSQNRKTIVAFAYHNNLAVNRGAYRYNGNLNGSAFYIRHVLKTESTTYYRRKDAKAHDKQKEKDRVHYYGSGWFFLLSGNRYAYLLLGEV